MYRISYQSWSNIIFRILGRGWEGAVISKRWEINAQHISEHGFYLLLYDYWLYDHGQFNFPGPQFLYLDFGYMCVLKIGEFAQGEEHSWQAIRARLRHWPMAERTEMGSLEVTLQWLLLLIWIQAYQELPSSSNTDDLDHEKEFSTEAKQSHCLHTTCAKLNLDII